MSDTGDLENQIDSLNWEINEKINEIFQLKEQLKVVREYFVLRAVTAGPRNPKREVKALAAFDQALKVLGIKVKDEF